MAKVALALREAGYDVFDDWRSAGADADDQWRDYEKSRGHTYLQGLYGFAATNVFEFDRKHLARCDMAVLVMPAGKSAHLELGWVLGQGKPGYILLDPEIERWDVMYRFCTGIFDSVGSLIKGIAK